MGQTNSSLKQLKISPPVPESGEAGTISARGWETSSASTLSSTTSPLRLPFSSKNTSISSRSASPVPSLNGRKSPFQMPPRSATAPLTSRPPSIDLPLPQDSAFPKFPSSRSTTPTPTTPSKASFPKFTERFDSTSDIVYHTPKSKDTGGAPSISRDVDNDSVHKRLDVTAPGPLNIAKEGGQWTPRHHRKSSSITNSQDFIRSSSSSSIKNHAKRPSRSSSVYTRATSLASLPGNFRFTRDDSNVPAVPLVPLIKNAGFRPEVASGFSASQEISADIVSTETTDSPQSGFPDLHKSPAGSPVKEAKSKPAEAMQELFHKKQPSVAAPMAPLHEIGSASSFRPSKSLRGRGKTGTSIDVKTAVLDVTGEAQQVSGVPPVPTNLAHDYNVGNPYHTPNESVSSNGSSSSGVRSGSSRSTPPLHDSPRSVKGHGGEKSKSDETFQGFNFGVNSKTPDHSHTRNPKEMSPASDSTPKGSSQTNQSTASTNHDPPSMTPSPKPLDSPWEFTSLERSEKEPAISHGHRPTQSRQRRSSLGLPPPLTTHNQPRRPSAPEASHTPFSVQPLSVHPVRPAGVDLEQSPPRQAGSPLASPDEYVVPSSFIQPSGNMHLAPTIPPPPPIPESSLSSPSRRQNGPYKGPCRGCNEPIYGKSVSSADGQLTGRYHKQCFVCTTCRAAFLTTDFYVANNNPYCARHYHELNNSICGSCDRGIEGQYLELLTDPSRRKFHPHCFTCQDCHLILRDDYYEWNGRVLCEQHAFAATQWSTQQYPSSPLGPGRRFPEKRSTRLMMM